MHNGEMAKHRLWRPGRVYLGWSVFAAFVVLLFWMSVSVGKFRFPEAEPSALYRLLSEAFLSGSLSLNTPVPAQLLKLNNPYEMAQRQNIHHVWDASLFEGKYYLYFGPVPALTAFIPLKLLSGTFASEDLIVLIYSLLTVATLSITVFFAARRFDIPVPPWPILWVAYIVFASGLTPQLGGRTYVAAAISGMLFQALFMLALVGALTSQTRSSGWAFIGGCASVLAAGSRATHLLSVVVGSVILFAWIFVRPGPRNWRTFAAFVVPACIGVILLLAYNYARFGEVFEFGHSYQLGLADLKASPLCSYSSPNFSLSLIALNLWYQFFMPPRLIGTFPFFQFERIEASWVAAPPGYMGFERVSGILILSPLLLFGTAALLFSLRRLSTVARWYLAVLATIGVCVTTFILSCRCAASRYTYEIMGPWLIASILGLWVWISQPRARVPQLIVHSLCAFGLFAGISIGFLATFDGHFRKGLTPHSAALGFKRFVTHGQREDR